MNKIKHIFLLTAGVLALGACKPEVDTLVATTQGTADFSRYIAVGNSLTSGFADGGLYREGQLNSFPAIIAEQMKKVGGGEFTQPLFTEQQADGSGYLMLKSLSAEGLPVTQQIAPAAVRGQITVPTSATSTVNVTLYTKYTGDINNYGVPGIKLLTSTLPAYGNLNGYFERLLPNSAPNNNTSYIDFVTAKPFTFFSNWLGNNDALGYATAGGASDELTDKATFSALYNQVLNKLTMGGQKGVVATIPDVTSIPYFNTVTVNAILATVKKANPSVQALYINARVSSETANTTYAARPATAADLVVLTFPTSKIGQPVATPAGNLPYGLTPLTPIENQYVLDVNEAARARDYVASYNTTIKAVAASKGIAVADIYTFLNGIKQNGLVENGINLSSQYISGGLFSLDGIHLTPRGYAVVANEFIKAINKQYGSDIPQANISAYRGVKFP
ncbi:G-D-S-L family lipolytic protein [Mucilaginibacter sp. Bleaf8]|uniref:SGNH/GDSL hydrolase family protein n=1 Tax=Mucilaginibacter sp. Bleaf8 TaxID=2834430 RepID=UPI001BD0C218|nr:SGNH/GDSL hydrolase family protein [Mucilaginibacter sp. Bleaf8]MBS7566270.1 G-D-S-L family lipolytic protein [Mucilaginibacter sp. Bleaf8]